MKNSLFLGLFLLVTIASCTQRSASTENNHSSIYRLSGIVTELEDDQKLEIFYQSAGENKAEELKPDSLGNFSYELELDKARELVLRSGRDGFRLRALPGAASTVSFSATDLAGTVQYEGDLKNENELSGQLRSAERSAAQSVGSVYDLSPKDYMSYARKSKDSSLAMLELKLGSIDEDFATMTRGNIIGRWIGSSLGYLNRRAYYHPEDSNALADMKEACLKNLPLDKTAWLSSKDYLRSLKTVCSMNASERFAELEDAEYITYYNYQLEEAGILLDNKTLQQKTQASIMMDALRYNALSEDLEKMYLDFNTEGLNEDDAAALVALYNKWLPLKAGNAAPNFFFSDMEGKEMSLGDLKGKLVYVDVWATWCGPCKAEIPFLKELEEEYSEKEIVFLSVSIDSTKEPWEKMVLGEALQGTQVFTPGAWDSELCASYNIRSIPRFMLISQDGKILDVDAPRPSGDIREMLDANLSS